MNYAFALYLWIRSHYFRFFIPSFNMKVLNLTNRTSIVQDTHSYPVNHLGLRSTPVMQLLARPENGFTYVEVACPWAIVVVAVASWGLGCAFIHILSSQVLPHPGSVLFVVHCIGLGHAARRTQCSFGFC